MSVRIAKYKDLEVYETSSDYVIYLVNEETGEIIDSSGMGDGVDMVEHIYPGTEAFNSAIQWFLKKEYDMIKEAYFG